ncbi:hypothetical protein BASA81_008855 [Batrachochytrium salamandrivorans]|nr:hypothetical protein BASA81_008855 [Batrachochytrium salamandrivorans]
MSDIKTIKTLVVVGSSRQGRMGERVGKFIASQLKLRTTIKHEVDYLDLGDLQVGFMEQALGWMDPTTVSEPLKALGKRVADAEAFVFISPEYNHSMSPVLTNFLNHFPQTSYMFKPSAIVVYSMGPFGGVRAAMQMRALTGELGCLSVTAIFAAPVVQNSLDVEGKPVGEDGKLLEGQATKVLGQLEWYAEATKAQRAKGLPA